MGNHGSHKRNTIYGRHVWNSSLPTDVPICGERKGQQPQFESKPRNGVESRRQDEQFLYQKELEQKSRQKRRNQCKESSLQNRERADDTNRNERYDSMAGSLPQSKAPLWRDNHNVAAMRDVNGCMTRQSENIHTIKSAFEPEKAGHVSGFKKCPGVTNNARIMPRKTMKTRTSVGRHKESIAASHQTLSAAMNETMSATMNQKTSIAANLVFNTATKSTPTATRNYTPSSSASRRRFCILNKSDKNSFRVQMSIWFPCLCHKPTLKALQDFFIRMKRSLFQEMQKLKIIDFNKHITESKEHRDLFRKENLRGRSSQFKPIYFISNMVPESQNRICSLNFNNKSVTTKDIGENYGKEEIPINSKTKAMNNPERGPFTGHDRHCRHSLMYLDCEKLQISSPFDVSIDASDLEKIRPLVQTQTKQFKIPEWFHTMLKNEFVIKMQPKYSNELMWLTTERKQLLACHRRLQLGHLFPNSDGSEGDGCCSVSVREQELKLPNGISNLSHANVKATSSRFCCRNSGQKQTVFNKRMHETKRGLAVPMSLKSKDLANAPMRLEDNFPQADPKHFVNDSADNLLDSDVRCRVNDTNIHADTYPKNIKTNDSATIRTEQRTVVDKMNKSNSSVHGVPGILESSQAIVVDEVMGLQEHCMSSSGKSKLYHATDTTLHPNAGTSVGSNLSPLEKVTQSQMMCMAIDGPQNLVKYMESKLSPVILVQSYEGVDANVTVETIDIEDSQEIDMACKTGHTLDPVPEIHLDKNMKPEIVNEIILMDNIDQSLELTKGINTQPNSSIKLCENLESNMIDKIKARKHLDYQNSNHFNLASELHLAQTKPEKDAYIKCSNFNSKHRFPKSTSITDRKTTERYFNNSAKISESHSRNEDINFLGKRSSGNERTGMLPHHLRRGFREHRPTSRQEYTNECEFKDRLTSNQEKTKSARESHESTCAVQSNAVSKSSRESLIDFIKQQWRTCQTTVTDKAINEHSANHRDSNLSSHDTSKPSSPTRNHEVKPFMPTDAVGKAQKGSQSVRKEQSFETMCSERRENYLKICRTLENYYKSSSHDDVSSISSASARDPQTPQNGSVNSQTDKMSENKLFLKDKTDETPSRSELSKNTPMTANYEKYLDPGIKPVNCLLELKTKFLNADDKSAVSPQTCNIQATKLSNIKTVARVVPDPYDYDPFGWSYDLMNWPLSSQCVDTTNESVFLNTTDVVSSKIDIPNVEREWLTNRMKSSQLIHTNKPPEFFSLLTALDKLLERYFCSIEELQRRLENGYNRAPKSDKRKKQENKLHNEKNKRQKKKQLSESALKSFQCISYRGLNSRVTVEDSLLIKPKGRNFVKSLAWNSSVNNKQDSPPDSPPSDVDLIDSPSKSKRQRNGSVQLAGKESQLDDAPLNQEFDVAVGNEPKLLPEDLLSPENNIPESLSADDIATPAVTISASRNGSRNTSKQQTPQLKLETMSGYQSKRPSVDSVASKKNIPKSPATDDIATQAGTTSASRNGSRNTSKQQTPHLKLETMSGYQSKRPSVDSAALPMLSSRLEVTPEYPEFEHKPSDPTPPYRKQSLGSNRLSADYLTRDVGTITRENQLTDTHRQAYSSIYDNDTKKLPTFSQDESSRRIRTRDKQESYNLTTTEQEYVTHPLDSHRHTSMEYINSERTPGNSTKPDLRNNGKPVTSTEPSRKYYFASTESQDYLNGGVMPRKSPERFDFLEQSQFLQTVNSHPKTRIPDYCLNQTSGFTGRAERLSTLPRRGPVSNICEGIEQKTIKQGSDPCELSEAQVWFRNLCDRVKTNSRINEAVTQHPRSGYEDCLCDRNLRFDARICDTPTVCCQVDDCQRSRHNTVGVRDYRSTPFKEHGSRFRTPDVDSRFLEPSKSYNDITLLETPSIHDLNIHTRPQRFYDHVYPQTHQTEAPVDDKYAVFSDVALEKLQPVRQAERRPTINKGTQFDVNYPTESHLETPRQVITRSNTDSNKVCACVCTQTCACISKPNGSCLCGYISLNETIWPDQTKELLALNLIRNTEKNVNLRSVCIQTCEDIPDERRADRSALQKGQDIVKEMRSRQCSPIQFKCRNKKCQIGHSGKCKNEFTGTGPSLSDSLPCKTVSTHCHHSDRKTQQNVVTTRTKCVQTCSFSETKTSKLPTEEGMIMCCKCKQTLNDVTARQFETPDLSLETTTESFENNDKGCQCDTFQDLIIPRFDPGNENVGHYNNYQTTQPFAQSGASNKGQKKNALARMISEDNSDEEWQRGNEKQPISGYGPSQVERVANQAADSNACVLSHELTEQISGIIRNSRLLQQQAVLLRNKCKYLEGQGWKSINQNRHGAVSACRSLKCSNVLKCRSFKKNCDKLLDKNNNAIAEFQQKMDQEHKTKYCNNPDCYACFISSQWMSNRNDNVTKNSRSYRKCIRKYLGHNEKLHLERCFLLKEKNKDQNRNARSRKTSISLNDETSSHVCMYKNLRKKNYFINDPSEEAFRYMKTHFPDIFRRSASQKGRPVAVDTLAKCHNLGADNHNKEYITKTLLPAHHTATGCASDVRK